MLQELKFPILDDTAVDIEMVICFHITERAHLVDWRC